VPIYEYRCQRCGYRFEKLVRLSQTAQPVVCPNCGAEETERLLSAFATHSAGATSTSASCSTGGG